MRLSIGLALTGASLASGVCGGCGSATVQADERIVVDVVAAPNVNAAEGTPQPVRFRVWGVKDKALFESVPADKLVEGDSAPIERQGVGRAFEDGSSAWVRPGGVVQTAQRVAEEDEFAFVGIAVGFPRPRREVVALDRSPRPGYTLVGPEHRVVFTLEGDSIVVGGGVPAAK